MNRSDYKSINNDCNSIDNDVGFHQLPDEIIQQIVDQCDVGTLKNFCLTSKRYASFLNNEKKAFEIVKVKIRKSLEELELTDRFESLNGINEFQQINGFSVDYAISSSGFSHTIQCLSLLRKKRRQFLQKLDSKTGKRVLFCKIILSSLLFMLGLISFVMFFICFGVANDMYYKYPQGRIITKIPIVEEVKPSEFDKEQKVFLEILYNEKKDGGRKKGFFKEEVERKNEEEMEEMEEEEEEVHYITESKNVLFLWRFTSAAVCLALSSVFFILGGVIVMASPLPLLLLLLIPVLLPAVRMDEFTKVTYWIFFIPTGIVLLIAVVLSFVYRERFIDALDYCICCVMVPVGYLLTLAGFVLFVFRIDNMLPSTFYYAYIFAFPASAVSVVMFVWALVKCCDYTSHADSFLILGIPLFVYGVFFLPVCLRKDGAFTTSYHYALIPWYLATVVFVFWVVVQVKNFWDEEYAYQRRIYRSDLLKGLEDKLSTLLRAVLSGRKKLDEITVDSLFS